jgi:hypothetical protein
MGFRIEVLYENQVLRTLNERSSTDVVRVGRSHGPLRHNAGDVGRSAASLIDKASK